MNDMVWVQLVTILAVIQFAVFGILVGRARNKHGVPAPAMSGNEIFERYNRVHVNTLETLVFLLPSMWLAAQFWSAKWVALLGAVYLLGRLLYLFGYVADPKKRSMGFMLSMMPAMIMALVALAGIVKTIFRSGSM